MINLSHGKKRFTMMMMMMKTTTWTLWPLMVLIPTTAQQQFCSSLLVFHQLSGRGHLKTLAPSVRGGSDLFGLWKWQTGHGKCFNYQPFR